AEIRTVRRQPNNVGLWPARELPKGRRRTDLPFTSVAGRRQVWIILKKRQRFFVVAVGFALTPARCLRPRSRGPWARCGQGGYHACDALAVMEKKPASCLCFGRRFRHCHARNFSPPMFLPGSR